MKNPINPHRVYFPQPALAALERIYGRRFHIATIQNMLSNARDLTTKEARELCYNPDLLDHRYFLRLDDIARGTLVFELRDNTEGNGHTLVTIHQTGA